MTTALDSGDFGYTAGVIDGEGCLTAYMRPNGAIEIRVDVVNTNRKLLEWLCQTWGGAIYARKVTNARHKQQFAWELRRDAAVSMLGMIQDHLIVKAEQAETMISLWEQRGDGRKGREPISAELRGVRATHVAKLRELNRKGA